MAYQQKTRTVSQMGAHFYISRYNIRGNKEGVPAEDKDSQPDVSIDIYM